MEINNRADLSVLNENCDVELEVKAVAAVTRDPIWGEIKGSINSQQDLQGEFALYRKSSDQDEIDLGLSGRIDANKENIESAVNDLHIEVDRAEKAEKILQTNLDETNLNLNKTAMDLNSEIERAAGAEKDLESKKVDKTSGSNKLYGTDARGAQITYDALAFGKVDDVKYNSSSLVVNKVANLDGFLTYDDSELN